MGPEFVEKARRALLTGQPRLAELYMRRYLNAHPDSRARLALWDTERTFLAFYRAAQEVAGTFFDTVAAAFAPIISHAAIQHQARQEQMMAQFRIEQQARYTVRNPLNGNRIGGIVP